MTYRPPAPQEDEIKAGLLYHRTVIAPLSNLSLNNQSSDVLAAVVSTNVPAVETTLDEQFEQYNLQNAQYAVVLSSTKACCTTVLNIARSWWWLL
jgi:hypothetical protein